jgi:hypothetical protein
MLRSVEQHAAKMRLQNTDARRKAVWRRLRRELKERKLTDDEAMDQQWEFWEAVRADKQLAYQRRTSANASPKANPAPPEVKKDAH